MSGLAAEIARLKARQASMEARLAELEDGHAAPHTHAEKVLWIKRISRLSRHERKAALREAAREQEARRG